MINLKADDRTNPAVEGNRDINPYSSQQQEKEGTTTLLVLKGQHLSMMNEVDVDGAPSTGSFLVLQVLVPVSKRPIIL
jgi:hypothetical protein